MLNVDRTTICSWEQGETQTYQRTLDKISTLFNEVLEMPLSIGTGDN